jgi:hypothetical protein
VPRRVKIGDIIEIPTAKGLAYAQYTHKHQQSPHYGALIRVLDGLFESRPKDFADLVKKRHRFVVFFPLGAAVNRGIFSVVAHGEIPEEARSFPIFRSGFIDRDGKVDNWWLWDGEKEWDVGKLTPEQRALPILGTVNDTGLIYWIESGWTPETDSR